MTKREVLAAVVTGDGPLGASADDEPVFVLCARDVFAAGAIDDWIVSAERAGVNDLKVREAKRVRAAMVTWRKTHGSKVPD